MRNLFFLYGVLFFFLHSVLVVDVRAENEPDSGYSYIIPERTSANGKCVLDLDGEWQFRYDAGSRWCKIMVPGEAAMQGYAIRHDQEFYYKKDFRMPQAMEGKTVILRFDGVYSHARLYVNGKFVREHHGGFTRWDTDITAYVRPGGKNLVELAVTDRLDDISYGAGYAHHPIGGILRSVKIFALPENHMYDLHIETDLDEQYNDAVLKVFYSFNDADGEEMVCRLFSPDGKEVKLHEENFSIKKGLNVRQFPITSPVKWDAEHPRLYTLELRTMKNGQEISLVRKKIGFREVEIRGNRMFVNGSPVKLRGACRHDVHPSLGRTTTRELDSLDALMFKRANMNFVRTSHYPPSENFLEFCDRYGIYVECESAVCFVSTNRQKNFRPFGASQDDPAYTSRYLSQLAEMVKAFRSHAAVLFWSLGNESTFGKNLELSWEWLKKNDRTRPVIFSYPPAPDSGKTRIYDLLSMHYPGVGGNMWQSGHRVSGFQTDGMPVIFDEWAHPACYTYERLRSDPGIREFWGQSIDMMWKGVFNAEGGLGGAIWGYIDEMFMLPSPRIGKPFWQEFSRTSKPEDFIGNCVGYGAWGIVDIWRREKPEFWATKKAYSPVRLMELEVLSPVSGQGISLPLYNRFDHTDLQEITVRYVYGGKERVLKGPEIAPHQKGVLVIPPEQWKSGTMLKIDFLASDGSLIDRELVALGKQETDFPESRHNGPLRVEENEKFIIVRGDGFEIPFSKESGLMEKVVSGGATVLEKGPYLNLNIRLNHLSGEWAKKASQLLTDQKDWKKEAISYTEKSSCTEVKVTGTYNAIKLTLCFEIQGDGSVRTSYRTFGAPDGYVRECGLSFDMPDKADRLDWKRKGTWTCYPENAMSGNEGCARIYRSRQAAYGKDPCQPWHVDTHDFFYWADKGCNTDRPITLQAKAMKENIYFYSLSASDKGRFSVVSEQAALGCRLYRQDEGQLVLYANNYWDYPEIGWGNFSRRIHGIPYGGQMEIRF